MNKTCRLCTVGISIVEDEKDLVKVYQKVFAKHGIQICFVAFDGLEAVKKYVECTPKPHVILMDYRLPIMNGIEATREVMKIDSDARVVFLSADINVKPKAMQAGAYAFLKKPASVDDILNSVRAAINA